jgi:hypothetical protein
MRFLLASILLLATFTVSAQPPTFEEMFIARLGAEDQLAIAFSPKPVTQEQLDAMRQPEIQKFRAKLAKAIESGEAIPVPKCSELYKKKNYEVYSCEGRRMPEIYTKRSGRWYYGSGITPEEELSGIAEGIATHGLPLPVPKFPVFRGR